MDFELPFDMEFDSTALGITLLAEMAIGLFMFSGSFGWELIPLWSKVTIMALGAPLWYFLALKFLG